MLPTKLKSKMGKNKAVFTMRIGSLIDSNPNDYIGVYDAKGNLIGHEYNGQQFALKLEVEEVEQEIKNEKQLSIF